MSKFYNESLVARVRKKNRHYIMMTPDRTVPKKSNIFSRCKFCDGLKIKGICQSCGSASVCSYCQGVVQPDKTVRKTGFAPSGNISHTVCVHCVSKVYEDLCV